MQSCLPKPPPPPASPHRPHTVGGFPTAHSGGISHRPQRGDFPPPTAGGFPGFRESRGIANSPQSAKNGLFLWMLGPRRPLVSHGRDAPARPSRCTTHNTSNTGLVVSAKWPRLGHLVGEAVGTYSAHRRLQRTLRRTCSRTVQVLLPVHCSVRQECVRGRQLLRARRPCVAPAAFIWRQRRGQRACPVALRERCGLQLERGVRRRCPGRCEAGKHGVPLQHRLARRPVRAVEISACRPQRAWVQPKRRAERRQHVFVGGGGSTQQIGGKWHMWASRFDNHCGVSTCLLNSRVVHAVSTTEPVLGPYKEKERAGRPTVCARARRSAGAYWRVGDDFSARRPPWNAEEWFTYT
jgi:hypothetical protein